MIDYGLKDKIVLDIGASTGGFTGTFAAVDIPSGWSLAQKGNSVSICPKGLAIILK